MAISNFIYVTAYAVGNSFSGPLDPMTKGLIILNQCNFQYWVILWPVAAVEIWTHTPSEIVCSILADPVFRTELVPDLHRYKTRVQ